MRESGALAVKLMRQFESGGTIERSETFIAATTTGPFGPGSVVVMPGDWMHVSGCRAGTDCLFYQEGKGKFDFKPAADHSRNK